ncbi:GNAT family N-acetyltransferase [Lottiidibacillus patelloidae]|uniref:GNAT family N-acetyltransferase n=1 Tax=Lottiidibacillus patelloidae TaxID=2670334 RepID=A0A263BXS7_9BACI|nr:GNAT family N-acetyltransferase [Lottiidibacillus patelloidae]OZM58388.1 GNAT family N-acetyltransferase [Lottiidibacillus patelloidae]
MGTHFEKLTSPSLQVVEAIDRWENDSTIIPLTRPNQNKSELERRTKVTVDELKERLKNHHIYLIYHNDRLIGEMNFMVDPGHLLKKEKGAAWIGITIGEAEGRGKGIGYKAIEFLEKQIQKEGLKRIELGVFEFNKQAIKLYHKMGYKEIGRIDNFTYWQDRMWTDIRMEKYL